MIETQPPVAEASGETWEQQKIVQALSDTEYKWRSLKRLAAVTGLKKDALDAAVVEKEHRQARVRKAQHCFRPARTCR